MKNLLAVRLRVIRYQRERTVYYENHSCLRPYLLGWRPISYLPVCCCFPAPRQKAPRLDHPAFWLEMNGPQHVRRIRIVLLQVRVIDRLYPRLYGLRRAVL
jgi:hypothetical protein